MRLPATAPRRMLLAAQGLDAMPRRKAGKEDVAGAIRRMGALQIDTISVVARSHQFVLWSRLGDYRPEWLNELLAEGRLFEYWSHAACFLPIEDYALYLPFMPRRWARTQQWMTDHADVVERVRARVRERGEVRSADFERKDGGSGTWFSWKPEKIALECLFQAGELMIARRDYGFQRVYALRESVLPQFASLERLSLEEAQSLLVNEAIRCLGAPRARWITQYFGLSRMKLGPILDRLGEQGQITRVEVEGWDEPAYVHQDHLEMAQAAADDALRPRMTTFLSPFDPVVWDRERAQSLFGFRYTAEMYTPGHQRRYGYFTLPVLYRDRLVGRMDAKAHRKTGGFEVKVFHLEEGLTATEGMIRAVGKALVRCATWHRTPDITITRSDPPGLAAELRRAVQADDTHPSGPT